MRRRIILFGLLFGCVVVTGCDPSPSGVIQPTAIAPVATARVTITQVPGDTESLTLKGQAATLSPRLIIKNARLSLTVEAPLSVAQKVTTYVEEIGGWLITSNVSTVDGYINGEISVRVPAEKFVEAVAQFRSYALEVRQEIITGSDVTDQYADALSRVKNLEAAEAQIREFMDRAADSDAVLRVYNRLIEVRGEIERIRGRIQFFEQASAFSSIELSLRQPQRDVPIVRTRDEWNLQSVVEDAWAALVRFVQGAVNVVVWLVIVGLPVTLIIGLPLLVMLRVVIPRLRSLFAVTNVPDEPADGKTST